MAETITVDVSAGTPEGRAEALVRSLLLTTREIRQHAPDGGKGGTYIVTAVLHGNDSWYWSWQWFPEDSTSGGGSTGKLA